MKISTLMSYAHGFGGATQEIVELEKAGLDERDVLMHHSK